MLLRTKSLSILKIFVLISVLLLAGCRISKQIEAKRIETLNAWIGSTKGELIQSWGAPKWTESDGQGGKVLVYLVYRTMAKVEYGSYMDEVISYYTDMYVNSQDRIYQWRKGSR